MPLIKRLSRAFKADMHAVLDTLEEPIALLKQAVREMEDSVCTDQQRLTQLLKAQQQQDNMQQEHQQQLNSIDDEISVSFSVDEHNLARKAIKRKLELERVIKLASRQQQTLITQIKDLQKRLSENKEKLSAMRQKQEIMSVSDENEQSDKSPLFSEISVSDDEVEIAFLKEKQARVSS